MRMGALREYRDLLLIVSTCFLTYFDKSATEWSKKRASELFIYIYILYKPMFHLGVLLIQVESKVAGLAAGLLCKEASTFSPVWRLAVDIQRLCSKWLHLCEVQRIFH